MKLNKLLTPILGVATLSTVIVPITSSCASQEKHVWLSSIDEAKKDANGNYAANYYFGLDKDTYTTNDVNVVINSSNRDDFKLTHFVSGQVLVVNVIYAKEVEEATTVEFDIKIWTSSWTSSIQWLKMNVEEQGPKIIDLDKWIVLYTQIYNKHEEDLQANKYYHKVNVLEGTKEIKSGGLSHTFTVGQHDIYADDGIVVIENDAAGNSYGVQCSCDGMPPNLFEFLAQLCDIVCGSSGSSLFFSSTKKGSEDKYVCFTLTSDGYFTSIYLADKGVHEGYFSDYSDFR